MIYWLTVVIERGDEIIRQIIRVDGAVIHPLFHSWCSLMNCSERKTLRHLGHRIIAAVVRVKEAARPHSTEQWRASRLDLDEKVLIPRRISRSGDVSPPLRRYAGVITVEPTDEDSGRIQQRRDRRWPLQRSPTVP